MASSDAELFLALKSALEGMGVRWYLFGALAALLHGAERFTADVDVTVELAERPTSELVEAFVSAGFSPRFADGTFIERTRVIPFVHDASGMPVDVVLAGPGIESTFFDGVVERTIDGVTLRVARVEDLVVMKVLAGRPKDLEDVVAVVSANAEHFDEVHTRRLLSLLEEALDQSDLVPLLEQTLRRVRR